VRALSDKSDITFSTSTNLVRSGHQNTIAKDVFSNEFQGDGVNGDY